MRKIGDFGAPQGSAPDGLQSSLVSARVPVARKQKRTGGREARLIAKRLDCNRRERHLRDSVGRFWNRESKPPRFRDPCVLSSWSMSSLYTRNPVSAMILTILRKYSGALISGLRCSDHVR